MKNSFPRRLTSEFLGTGFLVAAVVGSGIMADRLCGGNSGLALLANTIATGAALVALILTLSPISGAHLNPAVTLAEAIAGGIKRKDAIGYAAVQTLGGLGGTIAANLMFGLPAVSVSLRARRGPAQWFSEFVATFGLVLVIWVCLRVRSSSVALAVGAYITAAYWFTASTSFANPAVTIARAASNTFAGIRPSDVPGFIAAQLAAAVSATLLCQWLGAEFSATAKDARHS